MASAMKAAKSSMVPIEVLVALSKLLGGLGFATKPGGEKDLLVEEWAKLPWEKNIFPRHSPPQESGESTSEAGEESNGCDFSSFPSLSLQKKASTSSSDTLESDNLLHHTEDVQAHVAALLSRPILVSNDQEKRSGGDEEEEEDDEVSEFVEDLIARVPQLMQQNLVLSFSTLVQSRIRAYATFLARHGLSLAATNQDNDEDDDDDGVVGIEQKLETLLDLGNLVALGDVQMSFSGQPQRATISEDEDDQRASMPLNLQASISVLIPTPTPNGRAECLTMHLHTSGSITGIFTKDTENPLLRVVQVDLDMPQLLSSMKAAAANTVSRIVDITNATYTVPLPRVLSTDLAQHHHLAVNEARLVEALNNANKKRPHVIEDECSPDLRGKPASNHPSDLDLGDAEEDLSSLSPDKCGKIVDSLFDKIDLKALSPPAKRVRFSPPEAVDAIGFKLSLV